jgi:YD repeat-containing protein
MVSKSLNHSAEAGRYEWDENGRLVSATISLGTKIDSGYPSTSNYPVTCSLAPSNLPGNVKGAILAAIKLAHEFGHVNHTAIQDIALYQLQNELIPEYNRIFKLNGFHIDDPKLIELARLMRGTPPEISQEREYQAEANVIDYLQERFSRNREHREMPQPIRQAIESFYGASSGR